MKRLGHVHKRWQDVKARLMTVVWYRWLFAEAGRKCAVAPPFYTVRPDRIKLGHEVYIGPGCRIETVPEPEGAGGIAAVADAGRDPAHAGGKRGQGGRRNPLLVIGDRVRLGHRVVISAMNRVEIGADSNIASGCYISDNNYAVDPEGPPYRDQPMTGSATKIGKSVWIGHNVSVLAGATIGDRAVIGAGSVVRGEIPPLSVAVGVPARVVKRYDFGKKAWVRANDAAQVNREEQADGEQAGREGRAVGAQIGREQPVSGK